VKTLSSRYKYKEMLLIIATPELAAASIPYFHSLVCQWLLAIASTKTPV